MDAKLVVLSGRNAGREIELPVERFRIGRATDCHLRPQSPVVGEHHCEIVIEPGEVRVEDCGTPTGTLVNGQRIEGRRVLKNGDRLKIGPLEFEVQLAVRLGGRKRPKVQSVSEAAARAAQAAAQQEFDPTSWLQEDETDDPPAQRPAGATSAGGSQSGPPASPQPPAPTAPAQANQTTPEKAAENDKNKRSEKPQVPERPRFEMPQPEDSASAAADMLRRYMRGKR